MTDPLDDAIMRTLVVEDDPMIGKSVRLALREDGFAVSWGRDGKSADLALRSPALVLACAAILALSACAERPPLPPVPADLVDAAQVPGYGAIRQWGDAVGSIGAALQISRAEAAPPATSRDDKVPLNVLAISGGGANGSFAAGILSGWTEAGTRPEFHIVTGVSVGALTAPFAFLGPKYDRVPGELFTQLSAGDIIAPKNRLLAFLGDSLASPQPLQALIEQHVDEAVMHAIAVEHRRGRRLYVATTHVYAGRQVVWDIGAIADSGRPDALALIHRVLLASASVPILLPPVYIDVEAGGRHYHEMHVDGGITRQAFMGPPRLDWAAVGRMFGTNGHTNFFVIRNGRAASEYMVMRPDLIDLGDHAMHQLTQSLGIGDLYMIYLRAQRENASFHGAWIGDDFNAPWASWYDRRYVSALFD